MTLQKTKIRLKASDNFSVEEAFKVLRTNIQFSGPNIKVISFTSSNENEGKTSVSLGIARSFAELGKKVLVIDADMRKSVIASVYSDAIQPIGLSELLSKQAEPEACIYQTQYKLFHMIFSGKYPPNPAELLNGNIFNELLASARDIYDYIFIDTPPLNVVIDAAIIAPKCDGTIIVLGNGRTTNSQLRTVINQLHKSNSHILGLVRTGADASRGDGYYGYGSSAKKKKKHHRKQN